MSAVTKEDILRLEAERIGIEQEIGELRERLRGKLKEITEARISYAAANPHPWLGKKVRRTETYGYDRPRRTRVKRGIVALYEPALHKGCRELSTFKAPKPGDPIVLIGTRSAVTLTQHRYYDGTLREGETDWELEAGQ